MCGERGEARAAGCVVSAVGIIVADQRGSGFVSTLASG